MLASPDPEMRSPTRRQPGEAKSQKSSQQQQTYTISPDVQDFIAALLPLAFPFVCALTSWRVS